MPTHPHLNQQMLFKSITKYADKSYEMVIDLVPCISKGITLTCSEEFAGLTKYSLVNTSSDRSLFIQDAQLLDRLPCQLLRWS